MARGTKAYLDLDVVRVKIFAVIQVFKRIVPSVAQILSGELRLAHAVKAQFLINPSLESSTSVRR